MIVCYECGDEIPADTGDFWTGDPNPWSWRSRGDTQTYCLDCITDCEDCGSTVLIRSVTGAIDDGSTRAVCEPCYDNYGSCDSCGEGYHNENLYYQERGRFRDGVLCGSCDSDSESSNSSDLVHCYTYNPYHRHFWFVTDNDEHFTGRSMRFRGIGAISNLTDYSHMFAYREVERNASHTHPEIVGHYRDLFMGFELETNNISANIHEAAEFVLGHYPQSVLSVTGDTVIVGEDYWYLKEDGSISGFEIVSHPATLEAHKRLLPRNALRELAQMGMASWKPVNGTGAGLHVHVHKASFSYSHLHKFQLFHYENSEFLKKFAGRDSGRWASFDRTSREYGEPMKLSDLAKGDYYNRDLRRYHALNFVPQNTVELRYFRGSLKPETVLAVLEMVDAIWKFTRATTSADYKRGGLQWHIFQEWLVTRSEYEFLPEVMSARGVN